jgi:hypothetical protein
LGVVRISVQVIVNLNYFIIFLKKYFITPIFNRSIDGVAAENFFLAFTKTTHRLYEKDSPFPVPVSVPLNSIFEPKQ